MFKNQCERLQYFCDQGWCSTEQLQKYVKFKVITPEEYKTIAKEEYPTEQQQNESFA